MDYLEDILIEFRDMFEKYQEKETGTISMIEINRIISEMYIQPSKMQLLDITLKIEKRDFKIDLINYLILMTDSFYLVDPEE